MSAILKKSRNELKGFFAQPEDFESQFSKYYPDSKSFRPSGRHGCPSGGGVPLSYNKNSSYIAVDDSDAHTLVIGATASKKSRLVAMPMVKILSEAKESMIIVDPKSEIYNRTAEGLRENGYNVMSVDLRNPHFGSAWNPLAIPFALFQNSKRNNDDKAYDRACEFVNDIANNLSKMQFSDKDPFWENSAASFLFGLIMLLFRYAFEKKLNAECVNIRNILELRKVLCKDFWAGEVPTLPVRYAQSDPFVYSLLIGTLEAPKNTQASILSTFDQRMRTFTIQPSLCDMLACDDNIIKGVRDTPTALFLIVPDEKTSYHNLVSLFIKQSYEYFIHIAQNSDDTKKGIRINYILDEFSSLPTIADFPAMITAARSRDIRFTLFVQSKHQLDLRYREEAETIRANCNNWIFLVSREVSLLQELSTLCGTRRRSSDGSTVPLMSITSLQRLDKNEGEALILSGRNKPFIASLRDITFYDKDNFTIPAKISQRREPFNVNFDFNFSKSEIETNQINENFIDIERLPVNTGTQQGE